VVDLDRRQVRVTTTDGRTVTYLAGSEIPIFCGASGVLKVADIFRY